MKITKTLMMIGVVAGLAFAASSAKAACEGGSIVTGLDNKHEYCYSNNSMNWWSAYTWCEAQGRHMATIYELCPDWDGSLYGGGGPTCNNLRGLYKNGWSSTAVGTNEAVFLYSNSVRKQERSGGYTNAYCY